ncbi:unnamed protein product [Pneumocystis jirovecii]|uniref:Uncharacterized protein n=1 Tax=Pneumocystis jirovecii TaxID=42068 RepID=L0PG98_PNEJI|nr:unnamed protein product [Pneumocystis jirovecii]
MTQLLQTFSHTELNNGITSLQTLISVVDVKKDVKFVSNVNKYTYLSKIIGVVTQQQFIKFLWENYNSYRFIDGCNSAFSIVILRCTWTETSFGTTYVNSLSVIKYKQGLKDRKDSAPHFLITINSTLDFSLPSISMSTASSDITSPYLLSQSSINTLSITSTLTSLISLSNQIYGIMFSNLEFLRVVIFTDISTLIAKAAKNSFDTSQIQ